MRVHLPLDTLIKLNGVKITDESRQPVSITRDERAVKVQLASGKTKKYIQEICQKIDIEWENVPANSSYTIDGYGGRDELALISLVSTPIEVVVMDGRNSDRTISMFVDDYNEV